MLSLEEIKKGFENRDYLERMDFIDEYDFDDDYLGYYKSFIIENDKITNPLYLSDLIDLSAYLGLFNKILYQRYRSYLFEKRHTVVKLATLDYMINCPHFYTDKSIEHKLNKYVESKIFRILKNQVYINLMSYSTLNRRSYLKKLKESLTTTSDWKSIYRTLVKIDSIPILKMYKIELFDHIKKLNEQQNYGDGVKKLLTSLHHGENSKKIIGGLPSKFATIFLKPLF